MLSASGQITPRKWWHDPAFAKLRKLMPTTWQYLSDLFWLTDAQMARLARFFPKSHGKPRVDDRRVLSGIIFINRNGLRWRDAPSAYDPHKTLYSRWKRWSEKGIFARMMVGLAAAHGEETTVMIDATLLKAHRTATSMAVKNGGVAA